MLCVISFGVISSEVIEIRIVCYKMADTNDTSEVDKENVTKRAACSGLRSELKNCIMSSDCVIKYGHSAKECLHGDLAGVDNDCRLTQQAFFECKRSLIDFRNRFRGRKGY